MLQGQEGLLNGANSYLGDDKTPSNQAGVSNDANNIPASTVRRDTFQTTDSEPFELVNDKVFTIQKAKIMQRPISEKRQI